MPIQIIVLATDNLLQQLQAHPTEAILLASRRSIDAVREFASAEQRSLTEISPASPTVTSLPHRAFAVVVDYLEHLDKSTALHQLGQWRNMHCNHMWIAVAVDHPDWQFADFIGLGCKRLGQFELSTDIQGDGLTGQQVVNAYGYDLGHYNHRRQWNNPRYWANPERWNDR